MQIRAVPTQFTEGASNPPLQVKVEGFPHDPTGSVVTVEILDFMSRTVALASVAAVGPDNVSQQTGAVPFDLWDFEVSFIWGAGDLPDPGVYVARFTLTQAPLSSTIDAGFKVRI